MRCFTCTKAIRLVSQLFVRVKECDFLISFELQTLKSFVMLLKTGRTVIIFHQSKVDVYINFALQILSWSKTSNDLPSNQKVIIYNPMCYNCSFFFEWFI